MDSAGVCGMCLVSGGICWYFLVAVSKGLLEPTRPVLCDIAGGGCGDGHLS